MVRSVVSIHSPKDEFYRLAAEAISFPSPLFCEGDHGNAPCYPGSKPGILLLDSSPIIFFAPHLENDSS